MINMKSAAATMVTVHVYLDVLDWTEGCTAYSAAELLGIRLVLFEHSLNHYCCPRQKGDQPSGNFNCYLYHPHR